MSDRCIEDAWQILRKKVIHRDGGECQVCGHVAGGYKPPSDENPEGIIPTYQYDVHHIEQVSKGGDDDDENLTTLCCKHHRYIHCGGYKQRKTRRRLRENLNL